ncbi:homoserine acetyltransferase [Terriglobus roseus DSM 18391]|uniref:Homoserine acetyltransferase n=1 Tax=Terriglobus roseus (strain DSM 18391 / NRRL B-41598 / KBS 63) TaxID=926566 RepID=I3ZLA1_TERRK|nr:alpha/beta fold hydrolase [Terriglobus roseus]AFL90019.1 homoserine acetyltransferase [Terriglobus roseus DSM 18391]
MPSTLSIARTIATCVACAAALFPLTTMAQKPAPFSSDVVPKATTSDYAKEARDGEYVLHDVVFGSGERLATLRLHYKTLGSPHRNTAGRIDNAVLILHGTGDRSGSMLTDDFAGPLFGRGDPLDIQKYYIVLPDDIGHGKSSKPSDGLHASFPHYDYDDMVQTQHRMLLEGMGIAHLRLVLGVSMGGMQAFVWGETYPGFADALMPLTCLPVPIAGRNRMMRYAAMQAIRNDPAYRNGEYKTQPPSVHTANTMTFVMGSSPLVLQEAAPTRAAAEAYVDRALAQRDATTDANDFLYYIDSSRNYDASQHLDRITVPITWVNAADDFINPPELHIAEHYAPQLKKGQFVLLPISKDTRGHGTNMLARIWRPWLVALMQRSEPSHPVHRKSGGN